MAGSEQHHLHRAGHGRLTNPTDGWRFSSCLGGLALLLLLVGCSRSAPEPTVAEAEMRPLVIQTESLDPFLSQTISNAQAAVRIAPASPEAWGRLGESLHAAEFHREAIVCYRRAHELAPHSARWLYLLSILQVQDDPALGLSNMQRAVEMIPATNVAVRLRFAQTLAEHGRADAALGQLHSILAVDTNHPAARLELARLKFHSGDIAPVEELLRPSMTNVHTARLAHLLLSQTKERLGDSTLAEALARRAAGLPRAQEWPDPYLRDIKAIVLAGEQNLSERANHLLIQGRVAEAEKLLDELLRRSPDSSELLLLLGRLRIQQRRCSEAETILRRHLALQTNSLQGFVQLGVARVCDGRWTEAAAAFREATRIKPDFAQAHYNLGIALSRGGDSAAAILSFQEAIRAEPADASAHGALAEEYLRTGDLARARRSAELALRLDPKHAKALKVLQALE